jgi:pyrroloquinoline quinone (PQQ) biosynthesis protein C
MPLNYVIEMFCDRVAASKIYQGDKYTDSHPIEYFQRGRDARVIHQETSDMLEKLLVMLKEKGEDETFRYIREELKNKKDY